jgi:hypothetical protein
MELQADKNLFLHSSMLKKPSLQCKLKILRINTLCAEMHFDK